MYVTHMVKTSDKGGGQNMKRKVKFDAARKSNFTPKESMPDTEFSAEADFENPMKGANRNSKKGNSTGE